MLGEVLPARNDPWLNAGPRALVAFTADNADVKFPFRVPIQKETHDTSLMDIKRHPSCGSRNPFDQALDMQAVMAAIAGYFGGYTSKMQPIGERQIKQLREGIERKVAGAGITLTPAPAATETTTKDRNAIRALEAAAAASGDASLVEASRLIDTEGAQNAAYALVVTMAAANSCNAKARPVMRTAERAVREVVVSRCCSWPQLRDRGAFLEAVEQAFGSPLDRELRARLLVAYHRAVKEKLAEPPSVQVLAKQLRMSIGILLRDAVPDFPQRIAEFLSQHALSAEMVSATPSGGSTLSATVTRLA